MCSVRQLLVSRDSDECVVLTSSHAVIDGFFAVADELIIIDTTLLDVKVNEMPHLGWVTELAYWPR